jgi:Mn2+/Fe2+ NRAMP family transporter
MASRLLPRGRAGHLVTRVRIASDRDLMHLVPTRRATIAVAWFVIGVVTTLNLILIVLIAAGVPAALRQAQRA